MIGVAMLSLCAQTQAVQAVSGAVIIYGLDSISQEDFERICNADEVRYVCMQQIFSKKWDSSLARDRAEKLAKANKRIILQIWWGPAGDFPWSKYSFPNIALDESVRTDFFRDVVDACIAAYGAKNLYGVHLLEETGMQFATDVGPRENPDDFWTFESHANSYDTPWYSGFGNPKLGGVNIANVRRHEKDFTRMTGFTFANHDKWGALEQHLFDRWVSTRLQSGGQVEFAKHIHRKYPKLKAFTWDLINSVRENSRTDHRLEAQYFDGVITDTYSSIFQNFCFQRAYRTLYPKTEIINFAMGGAGDAQTPYASADTKRARAVGAYLAGVDVLGFFEYPPDFKRQDSWKINIDIFGKMNSLPRFEKKSELLLISDGASDVYSCALAWTGLKYFDFLPTWEAHNVDLSLYKVVILHSEGGDSLIYWNSGAIKEKYRLPGYLDYRKLDKFVSNGGTLILSGQTRMAKDCPLFIVREGYLHTADSGGIVQKPFVVYPRGWLYEKAGLKQSYTTSVTSISVTYDAARVTKTDAGYFFRHAKGSVFFFPFLRMYDPAEPYTSREWQDYRQLLSDVTRGVLGTTGKREIAQEYIDDPKIGNYYMQATSDNKKHTGYVLLDDWLGSVAKDKWQIQGTDILTKTANPMLSRDMTTAVINKTAK